MCFICYLLSDIPAPLVENDSQGTTGVQKFKLTFDQGRLKEIFKVRTSLEVCSLGRTQRAIHTCKAPEKFCGEAIWTSVRNQNLKVSQSASNICHR